MYKDRYHVRELVGMSEDDIWDLPKPGKIDIEFEDGITLHTDTVNVMIGSWYLWSIAAIWPEVKIPHTLFIKDNTFTDSLFCKLLWEAIEPTMGLDIDKEEVWRVADKICNRSYNAIVGRCMQFMGTAGYKDIIELLDDPDISEANCLIDEGIYAPEQAHASIEKVFLSNKYSHSPIIKSIQNKTVKIEAMLQSIGPVGKTTDIDSVIWSAWTKRGFARGLADLPSYAMATRSASKSLLFNKDPVAEAEYFNRKMQLACSVIERIRPGDCGTTDFHELPVDKGLFKSMVGLYQVMDDGKPREILETDTHLIGTTVRFRTTLCCKATPNQEVCEVCYGIISYSLAKDDNPGHVSSTALNEPITQIIISTKHLDFIIHKFVANLTLSEKRFLETRKKREDRLYLKQPPKGSYFYISFSNNDAPNLTDVNYMSYISKIDIARLSSIGVINVRIEDTVSHNHLEETIDLVRQGTPASLTVDALNYLKKNSWLTRKFGRVQTYEVDLSKWSYDKPFFTYQQRHESMCEFATRVETFLRSNRAKSNEDDSDDDISTYERRQKLTSYQNIDKALFDAHYLLNEKLKNPYLGHIATILMASRANDPTNGDWSLPAGKTGGRFCSHNELIVKRSLSAAMLFEKQYDVFVDPDSYLNDCRPTCILDDLIYIEP